MYSLSLHNWIVFFAWIFVPAVQCSIEIVNLSKNLAAVHLTLVDSSFASLRKGHINSSCREKLSFQSRLSYIVSEDS
jgi:hypothetical protein